MALGEATHLRASFAYPRPAITAIDVMKKTRKHREGKRIVSVYIGLPGSEEVAKAESDREAYLLAKRSLAELKLEEKRLRRAIKDYAGI